MIGPTGGALGTMQLAFTLSSGPLTQEWPACQHVKVRPGARLLLRLLCGLHRVI